jgi:hypothetical protein
VAYRDGSLPGWLKAVACRKDAKPQIVRELVERASHGPYLELFGQEESPGWTVLERSAGNSLHPRGPTSGEAVRR